MQLDERELTSFLKCLVHFLEGLSIEEHEYSVEFPIELVRTSDEDSVSVGENLGDIELSVVADFSLAQKATFST